MNYELIMRKKIHLENLENFSINLAFDKIVNNIDPEL